MNDAFADRAGSLTGFGTGVQSAASSSGRLQFGAKWKSADDSGVWRRVGLLFVALCAIKLVMLIQLRKYLFQIHWRVGAQSFNWVNEAAFGLFAILVGMTIWRLGTRCARTGVRGIRLANGCVLLLGAAFIFLTFHVGDKNYLYPIMDGTLSWADLRWYLAMNFFFGPPYLAAWILGYAFLYYGLWRAGHEQWMLRVTAVCAVAYTIFCLRGLVLYTDALLVADVIGIVTLLAGQGAKRSIGLLTLAVPLLCLISMFLFFGQFTYLVGRPSPELIAIAASSLIFLIATSLFARRHGFIAPWSWAIPFAAVVFLLLANINYPIAHNYRNLLCLGLMLPRYFLGELGVALVLLAAGIGYRRWRPSGALWWLDGLNLALIALALIDLRLSQVMGVRLDWHVISVGFGETPKMMWRMSRPYLPLAVAALAGATLLYAGTLWIVRRSCRPAASHPGGAALAPRWLFLTFSFVLLGVAGRWLASSDKAEGETLAVLARSSPLWQDTLTPLLDARHFEKTARQLGMVELTRPHPPTTAKPPRNWNVVLIFQESSYNKYLSLFDCKTNTQPLLSKYKDRMELFPNFYSSFAGSIYARFATFTGLYPVLNYREFTQHRVNVQSIFQILHHHGYRCSLFYSSYLDYTGFRDFLRDRGLSVMYDADTMPGRNSMPHVSWGLHEAVTMRAIQSQIRQYAARKQKFFLTYVPAAPHNPFDGTPKRFREFKPGAVGDFAPVYMNELLYMDWVISSIVDQLKTSGLLNHTLVVITDDHGEMLGGSDGAIGHGWRLTPRLANIPLIIMDPARRGYRVNDTVGSQVDLLPTMLDLLRIPMPAGQLCEGDSLYSAAAKAGHRVIYLNTFQQYGIIKGHDLFTDDRETETEGRDTDRKGYRMANHGARTSFPQISATNVDLPSITAFDTFQLNVLRHYGAYCREMAPSLAAR